jgi:hypothetical protein
VSGGITGAVTNVTAGDGLSGGGTGSVTLDVVGYQGLVANRGKTALEITSGTQKALAVVLGTESDEAAPGNHGITSHPETGLTAGHVLRATSATAYSFGALALRTVPDGGTGRDTLTANSVVIGDGINQVKLVTATTNGKVLGVQSGQWAEIDVPNAITNVQAGNGLSGGGTSGTVTLTVNANGENVANRGQTALVNLTSGGQALAVVLGTDGFTAAAGNHTHPAGDITSGTFDAARIPNLDTSKITTGTFLDARIPNLAASKITSGTFEAARIPNLDTSKITTGTFADARIPNLAASKITSGTFATDRIPSLDTSKITTGTFADARIPNLDAGKITTGTFNTARIPNLDTSKITTGTLDNARLNGEIADVRVQTSTPANPTRAGSLWFVV